MKKAIVVGFLFFIYSCLPYEEDDSWNSYNYSTNLYVYDIESHQKSKIEIDSTAAINNYNISSNGKTIIYTTNEKTVFYDMETGAEIQILDWYSQHFSISPSGNQFAHIAKSEGRAQIFIFSLISQEWTMATSDSLDKWNVRFASETTIYFLSGTSDIYKLNLSNDTITPIIHGNSRPIHFFWISSTETLIYKTYKSYISEDVFRYTLLQDSAVWIASTSNLFNLEFFAENDSILFDMMSGSERDVFTMSVNGGEKIKWTDDASADYDPSISSSGQYIVYQTVIEGENSTLTLINKTTKEVVTIEDAFESRGWVETPRFIPNTNKIIYMKSTADEE
ncbi:MAG: hypothetical protein HQ509_03870 [Candidatus Marinimicrobia bacterium]|nr:hypothetical protein [Candidatus Neomarinimicrobiota bacterium]